MKEIHIHLYGSIPLYYLKSISENDIDYENLEKTLTKVINKELDYHKAFDAFIYVNTIVNTDMKIENGTKELMKELIKDNVTYVELRTGLKKLDGTLETYLQSVIRGIHLGTENSNLKAYLILSFRRDTKKNIADETIDLAIKSSNPRYYYYYYYYHHHHHHHHHYYYHHHHHHYQSKNWCLW